MWFRRVIETAAWPARSASGACSREVLGLPLEGLASLAAGGGAESLGPQPPPRDAPPPPAVVLPSRWRGGQPSLPSFGSLSQSVPSRMAMKCSFQATHPPNVPAPPGPHLSAYSRWQSQQDQAKSLSKKILYA